MSRDLTEDSADPRRQTLEAVILRPTRWERPAGRGSATSRSSRILDDDETAVTERLRNKPNRILRSPAWRISAAWLPAT